jgi:hypothetical protein
MLLGLLLLSSLQPDGSTRCQATVVWNDNFNDTDYNGWTLELGSFTAADGSLRGVGATNALRHDTATTQGTWSFDVQILPQTSAYITLFGEVVLSGIVDECYTIRINQFGIDLRQSTDWTNTYLDQVSFADSIAGWQQLDVTRDGNGQFYVYLNGTPWLEGIDTTHDSASYFVFYCTNNAALDNVVVSDTVDIQPTTGPGGTDTQPAPIPGFPLVAVAIGLLLPLTVVLLQRYRITAKDK